MLPLGRREITVQPISIETFHANMHLVGRRIHADVVHQLRLSAEASERLFETFSQRNAKFTMLQLHHVMDGARELKEQANSALSAKVARASLNTPPLHAWPHGVSVRPPTL